MTERAGQAFHVLRQIGRTAVGAVLEAAPAAEPDARVTLWPGKVPNVPIGLHPVLAIPIGRGSTGRQPLWVEDRPPGHLLADIQPPLSLYDAARVVSQIADGIAALHARGHAHGNVRESRVVLAGDGSPVLIGSGVVGGSPEADLAALIELFGRLVIDGPPVEVESMAALAANLREVALEADRSTSTLTEKLAVDGHTPSSDATTIHLVLEPLGFTDEVQPDLGPEEKGRGLLDRWSDTSSIDDLTGDQTESISTSELAAQAQRVLLERVTDLYANSELAERFADNEGTGCASVQALIAEEPLDPLPIPEGVAYNPSNVTHDGDHTAEVTAEAPGLMEVGRTEETTGWTGPVETTSPAGLSTRWEWAMAGALVTLFVLALMGLLIFVWVA